MPTDCYQIVSIVTSGWC